jgi:inositol transporter-like SP family MFS transporter
MRELASCGHNDKRREPIMNADELGLRAGASRAAATGQDWKNTILAGLANYIDAGSIVAGSAALALWVAEFHLSTTFVGLIGAFSANAISAGVGALIGGRLCDRFGRKKIYQYDMIFYAFGMLWLVFAVQPWMIVVGFVLVGLAVGADIPASWSLIAELAPQGQRGKHSGVAQMLWYLGPVVVLLMSLALAPWGVLGARIVFAHLALVAIVLMFYRARMQESTLWSDARAAADQRDASAGRVRELFSRTHLKSMLFLIGMYGIWNLWAGTNGFFFPYILRTVGAQSQAMSVAMQAAGFVVAMISIGLFFMRYSDRVRQRTMFGLSAIIQVSGMALLALVPLTTTTGLIYLFLVWFGSGFGAQSFFQLWSAELFPTLLRSTAQGLTFAVVRIGLGLWSFFVPVLTAAGFQELAWILVGFLVVSGIIGYWGAPSHEGKSLAQIEQERHDAARG